ncbi:hypothetical protein ACXJJ3_42320 (plasmid) [Kribbella sp. WER1]
MTTTAERYARAAQSLGFLRGALMTDDPDSIIASAFTALGVLWGTESRAIWDEASQIAQELEVGNGYKIPSLLDRVGQLRDLLVVEAKRLTIEQDGPEVLIMIESDPDYPDDLMGEPFLICPHPGCDAEDDIRQVDVVTRWNNLRFNRSHDGVVISDGGSDDGEDHGYLCGSCERPVSFPEDIDANRSWA